MAKGGAGNFRDNSPAKKKTTSTGRRFHVRAKGHKPTMSVAKVAPTNFAANFDKTDSAGKILGFS